MSKKERQPVVRRKVVLTPAQLAEHRKIREAFKDWHPGPEELLASGKAAELGLNVIPPRDLDLFAALRAARKAAGLSLDELARRSGIGKPALSRLENGKAPNPTLDTLWRYAAAVGRRLTWSLGPIIAEENGNNYATELEEVKAET
jgi:DNA-binding XRE family transcriptional regulator